MKVLCSGSVACCAAVASALTWLALAVVVVLAAWLPARDAQPINWVMAVLFTGIAIFQAWRVRIVSAVRTISPAHRAMRRFTRMEALAAMAWLVVGLAALCGASFRLLGEHLPVFG